MRNASSSSQQSVDQNVEINVHHPQADMRMLSPVRILISCPEQTAEPYFTGSNT